MTEPTGAGNMPAPAVPIDDPVTITLDRRQVRALRSIVNEAHRRRARRAERSDYDPGPGHRNMDAVVAQLWADMAVELARLIERDTDQVTVPYRPRGTIPAA